MEFAMWAKTESDLIWVDPNGWEKKSLMNDGKLEVITGDGDMSRDLVGVGVRYDLCLLASGCDTLRSGRQEPSSCCAQWANSSAVDPGCLLRATPNCHGSNKVCSSAEERRGADYWSVLCNRSWPVQFPSQSFVCSSLKWFPCSVLPPAHLQTQKPCAPRLRPRGKSPVSQVFCA